MKSFITAALIATALAAPANLEKRRSGTVTVFNNANYGGGSASFTIDLASDNKCRTLPAGIAGQVSSVRLLPTNSYVYCQLSATTNCDTSQGSTWFFSVDVPNLASSDYAFDNRAQSIWCSDNGA
ncbi:hypothetical protein P154DRAFT_579922 [Amniculicola lignicola CBS 123094]|uniref:AA1-like domain-containing protein n=1 Tax=Amniculicola lignicola CBS 123094 TaxID=1392246 RepID=A0A6A5W5W5_9PLEO|nr:hypothetical protein P154DRAFT_579922 [Amniculicola lignicola CBS 123094]